jgi:hypothetical protein
MEITHETDDYPQQFASASEKISGSNFRQFDRTQSEASE